MGLADQDTLRALLPLIFQLSERSSIGFLRGQTLGSIRLHRFKPSFQGRFSNIQMSVLQIFWLEQNTRPKNRSEHSVVHSWLGNLIHQKPTKIQRSLLVTWSNENLVTLTLGKCLCSVVGSDQSPVQTWVQNRYLAISGWIQGFCPMTLPKTFIFPSFNKTLPVIFSPRLAKKWYHIQEQWSMMCQNFHSWWDQKKSVEVSHPNRGKKKSEFWCLMAFPEDTGPAAWEAQQWRRKANAPRANCLKAICWEVMLFPTIQCSKKHRFPLAIQVLSLQDCFRWRCCFI